MTSPNLQADLRTLATAMDESELPADLGGCVICPDCGHVWSWGEGRENNEPCRHLVVAIGGKAC